MNCNASLFGGERRKWLELSPANVCDEDRETVD